ncbi:DUF58 domain-containing protein [Aneurinibacillus aneurinilyticus]|jgi:uncharacterized protein (DUF58 family)|uniref:DUF58 domain-containing protein n=1 Tax=Aneurinibacillus aneurinilyticus TaxID=1391 RepID=A0A848CQA1_ANEAE|nr:DUF58 domain-containing protein [Aneurinibacillus aneurinilyticus]MCI1692808.1 DUF58 domain-containing protein [Aneurinibacillus aneurinilyticus]NME97368.1 DUF58 domain-containing protein [Aneurinibacillus aneurinilyticus]
MDDFLASLTGLMFVRKHLHSAFDAKSRRNARLTSTEDVIGHRLYAPGDDVRSVDWNAYARTGQLHVRQSMEEGHARLTIWLDNSASMEVTAEKWKVARQLAIGCAHVALQQGEWVRIICLTAGDVLYEGRGEANRLVQEILTLSAAGVADYTVLEKIRAHETNIIISDFFECEFIHVFQNTKGDSHDVRIMHILASAEMSVPSGESLLLVDRETGREQKVEMTSGMKYAYEKKMRHFLLSCAEACHSHDAMYIQGTDEMNPLDLLSDILEGR